MNWVGILWETSGSVLLLSAKELISFGKGVGVLKSIGIDIGHYSIKVVELLASQKSYRVTRCRIYKIYNPQCQDLEVEILQALQQIRKDFDLDSSRVVTSVPSYSTLLQKLSFPFEENSKIQKSIPFELEDHIPIPIEKTVYTAKILGSPNKGSSEVMAMACPLEQVHKTLNLIQKGHIDPDIITSEFSALSNIYGRWYESPLETTHTIEEDSKNKLIALIGHTQTFLALRQDHCLLWARSLFWGAKNMGSELSKSLQIPMEQALDLLPQVTLRWSDEDPTSERYESSTEFSKDLDSSSESLDSQKPNLKFSALDDEKISSSLLKSLKPFLQGVRFTLFTLQTEHKLQVDEVELLGPKRHIKNLPLFLENQLQVPTRKTQVFVGPSSPPIADLEKQDICLMALGLAIEGIKRHNNPQVNFRKNELAKKNLNFQKFLNKWSYTLTLLGIGYAFYFIYGIWKDQVATQLLDESDQLLTIQARKIPGFRAQRASRSRIESYIKKNKEQSRVAQAHREFEKLRGPLEWLKEISLLLPSNKETKSYEVRYFSIDNNQLTLQGVAQSPSVQKQIQEALSQLSPKNRAQSITPSIGKEKGKILFAYKLKVERK